MLICYFNGADDGDCCSDVEEDRTGAGLGNVSTGGSDDVCSSYWSATIHTFISQNTRLLVEAR